MSQYLLQHCHQPRECGVGHAIWWSVEAASEEEALRLLPAYVAARTTVTRVNKVKIP